MKTNKIFASLIVLSMTIFTSCNSPSGNSTASTSSSPDQSSIVNNKTDTSSPSSSNNPIVNSSSFQCNISTFIGDSDGKIKGTDYKLSDPKGMLLDNKGNMFYIQKQNIFKVNISSKIAVPLKFPDKLEAYTLPSTSNEFSVLFFDNKGQTYTHLWFLSRDKTFFDITLDGNTIQNTAENALSGNVDFTSVDGIIRDSKKNLFVLDKSNSRIMKISPDNSVELFAGGGEKGADQGLADGKGKTALFKLPSQITIDKMDNLYVADTGNNRIRKVTPDATVTTVAGSSKNGLDYGDADGKASEAQFKSPEGIAIDNNGNIFVADTINNRIRRISTDGLVTTAAGSDQGIIDGDGKTSKFNYPTNMIFDGKNNIYIFDAHNFRIRTLEIK